MPNTTYNFANVAGQTIVFDAATDVLSFDAGSAAGLTLTQGSGAGANTVVVSYNGATVILQGVTLDKLRTAALTFANGSLAQVGDGLATQSLDAAKNIINGTAQNDYIDGLQGDDQIIAGGGNDTILTGQGTDTVDAGLGNDTIIVGNELAAADRIDGGAGTDELRLSGNYNVTFVDGTVKNIETLTLAGDGDVLNARNYKFVTHDSTVADGAVLTVNAASLDGADKLEFDGSAELTGSFAITSGAGADNLKGGAGSDTIVAGAGNDIIAGGLGADVLTGGAGEDVFVVARGAAKSDSSPTSADRITDFQGAGVLGGDRIQLPVPNGGKPLAFAGYKAFTLGSSAQQAPNPGDGFADVFYDHFNGQTRIVVDVNDDGVISEIDQVILLDGIHEIQAEDFDAAFSVVRGTEAADDILGSAYGETINAQGGNDTVDGLGGNDTINGGLGDDDLTGGAGNDTINGDDNNDTLRGGDDNDTLNGGEGNDTLYGDAGGDTINGGNGVDSVDGGIGGDTINGGAGNDVLHGGLDADTLNGGSDQDQLFGDAGNDTLNGDAGDGQIDGGEDNDKLTGAQGTDTLHGGAGNDTIYGDDGNTGDAVIDYLYGDAGDDTLYAGTGRDVMTGGTGADKFVVSNGTSSAAFPNRITDFDASEGDKLQLSINSAKPLAWFGNKSFVFDGTFGNGGVQFPLANDGLADAIWDYDVSTNTTRIAVDVNDDGVFSTGDLLVYLDGYHELTAQMFVDTFAVVRGGAGADVMPGTAGADTYYGMGGADDITGEGGNDTLYGGEDGDRIDGGIGSDTIYGDAGNDILTGGEGVYNDTLNGGAGNDQICGGEGVDTINGGSENDILAGEAGDDTLSGEAGIDTLTGGDGADSLRGGDGDDQIEGGIGADYIDGGDNDDTIKGGDGKDNIYGGSGVDTIDGGEGDDTIRGEAGADVVDGGIGNDLIIVGLSDTATGGAGADIFQSYYNSNTSVLAGAARITDFTKGSDKVEILGIQGTGITFVFNGGDRALGALSTAAGSQTILGNAGDGLADVVYSTTGNTTYLIVDVNDDGKLDTNDVVLAFDGDIDFTTDDFVTGMFKVFRGSESGDSINGSDDVDTVYGVGGNDEIAGQGGNDKLYGGAGDDLIDGGLGQDTIEGGDDNDTLDGGEGVFTDYVYGQNGNDIVDGGEGNDYLYGQAGDDTLNAEEGDDYVYGDVGLDTLNGGAGNDYLRGGDNDDVLDGASGNDDLDGDAGADTMHGGDNNDTLEGGNGDDHLFGDGGNDTIYGDVGADDMDGGAGDDTLIVLAGDTAKGGEGADKFRTWYNSIISNLANAARIIDFEKGLDQVEITGVQGNSLLYVFNQGDQQFGTLSTAAGSQTVLGNAGDGLADIFYSTSANGLTTQLIVDVNDDGKLDSGDVVMLFDGDIDFAMSDFLAGTFKVVRGGAGADTLTGTDQADTIYGVGGSDTITGLDANDTLYGQAGDDTIDGGTGQDTIDGGADNDTLFGGAGNSTDYLNGGTGNDTADGGDGNDIINGQDGNDTLTGALGDDTLDGGNGDDLLNAGEGADTLRGYANVDTLNGGLGNDNLDGGDAADVLHGDGDNDTLDGGSGDDRLFGDEGNDTIYGGAGVDEIDGGNGDDTLVFGRGDIVKGGAGADKFRTFYNFEAPVLAGIATIVDFQQGVDKIEFTGIQGNSRNFAVNATELASQPDLGDALPFGNDAFADIAFIHLTGADGPLTRVFVDENDNGKLDASDLVFDIKGTVNLTAADFTAATFNAVRGTPGTDVLNGSTASDNIYGVDGNDTINGGAGGDYLYGQNGDDTIDGGTDNDAIWGGAGNDTLSGSSGYDSIWGETGDDTIDGGDLGDNLYGGADQDTLRGGFGDDTLNGDAGNDLLEGGADADTLNGGADADTLRGQDGADTLRGDAGNDFIEGGALNDVITGGAGNDTIDGGTEIDTAVFSGNIVNYEIVAVDGGFTVRDLRANGDGTDFLTNIEKLQFNDGTVSGNILTVSDGVVVEGDNGQKMMAFTVSLLGSPNSAVTVSYGTSNGSATAGTDYGSVTGSLTFGVGETSKTVYVPITGDTLNEIDETFSLTLSNASGAAIVDATGVGTILNDDCTVSVGDATVVEGNAGTKTIAFTVSLDKAAAGPISVSYQTEGVTALEGSDYTGASGILQFGAGEISKTIYVTVSGDLFNELDETFLLKLLSATGAKIGDGQATGTITNDDMNRVPVANADSFDMAYDQAKLELDPAALLGNDTDADLNTLTLFSVQGATHGTVAIVNGKIVFTPAAGYAGAATFTYTISDGMGGTATGNVTVNVAAPPLIDDTFNSTAANESFDGGDGSDTLSYATVAKGVSVTLGVGGQQATGGGGWDTLVSIENLHGSKFDDRLTGDVLANVLEGDEGNDILRGNGGSDVLDGGIGDDQLDGGEGADTMKGGAGNDKYFVDHVGDVVTEGSNAGSDTVNASIDYVLGANLENLTLTGTAISGTGNALDNTIIGNASDNWLDGGAGADTLRGGQGDDHYVVDNVGDKVIELDGQGGDVVDASVSYTLAGQYIEVLNLTGTGAINGAGNSLANRITGNSAANTLSGYDGNDRLDGGAGADRMIGGLGNDIFVVDNAGDVVVENIDEGNDTIESSISYSLAGRYIEVLKLTGSANINATGNSQVNTLFGNAGDNIINGGAGGDTMYGGAGDDKFIVDDLADKVFENVNDGIDTVESSVTFSLGGQYVENLRLTGTAAINGTGNNLANTMWGNTANNALNGSGGNDELHGGLGADTLTGGANADRYWFETALGGGNVDRITDFYVADDTIVLDRSIFSGIGGDGAITAGAFRIGIAAADADDRIVYDKATGNIWYDADGAGGADAVLFAQVNANTNLTAADFFTVA